MADQGNSHAGSNQGKKQWENDRGGGFGDQGGFQTFTMQTYLEHEGSRYDLSELKSVEKLDEYDEKRQGMVYRIVFNRVVTVKNNIPYIEFSYDTKEQRDEALRLIYSKMDSVSNVLSV